MLFIPEPELNPQDPDQWPPSTANRLIYSKHRQHHMGPTIFHITDRQQENQYVDGSVCCVLLWECQNALSSTRTHRAVDTLQMDKINEENTAACREQIN